MFVQVDHIAFLVADMEAGRREFEDVYGLECTGTNSAEHKRSTGAEAAFFDVGEVVIELLSPLDDVDHEGWPAEYMAEHGEGFFHVAYAVEDLERPRRPCRIAASASPKRSPSGAFPAGCSRSIPLTLWCRPSWSSLPTERRQRSPNLILAAGPWNGHG